jgi:hypothetical protein
MPNGDSSMDGWSQDFPPHPRKRRREKSRSFIILGGAIRHEHWKQCKRETSRTAFSSEQRERVIVRMFIKMIFTFLRRSVTRTKIPNGNHP